MKLKTLLIILLIMTSTLILFGCSDDSVEITDITCVTHQKFREYTCTTMMGKYHVIIEEVQ